MFFLPTAIFAHVPGLDWGDVIKNWVFAFLGNFVGAGVFVGGAYYYLYGRVDRDALIDEPGDVPPPGMEADGRTGVTGMAGRR